MAKVTLWTTPQYGDDTYNVYDDVEEITIEHKYQKFTVWFDTNGEMYIQAPSTVIIETETAYKHCIKIYT